jgi:hypothetical protein
MLRLSFVFICVLGLPSVTLAEEPRKLSDAEIKKLMVGKWEDSARFGNITIHTLENFKADGVVEREDTINGTQKLHVKSSWEIKDGVLITVVLEGAVGKGTTVKGKVVSIDDKTQKLEMEAGAEITKTRVK